MRAAGTAAGLVRMLFGRRVFSNVCSSCGSPDPVTGGLASAPQYLVPLRSPGPPPGLMPISWLLRRNRRPFCARDRHEAPRHERHSLIETWIVGFVVQDMFGSAAIYSDLLRAKLRNKDPEFPDCGTCLPNFSRVSACDLYAQGRSMMDLGSETHGRVKLFESIPVSNKNKQPPLLYGVQSKSSLEYRALDEIQTQFELGVP